MNATPAIHAGAISAHHDVQLVALSVAISVLGAYAAHHLTDRVRDNQGRSWLLWLAGAALVDAVGTWSMHYTGMLGLILPVPLTFDWRMVLLSYFICAVGSGAALLVLGRSEVRWDRAILAGVLLGAGISGLHYTAMAAITAPHEHHDTSPYVAASVAIAIAFAVFAFALHWVSTSDDGRGRARQHGGIILRGLANPLMHYTAMAGVTFVIADQASVLPHGVSIASLGVLGISIVPIVAIVVALGTSVVDRLQRQRALLDELFEQAPEPVALVSDDHRVLRVNRAFTKTFGYEAGETVGRTIEELIVPDEDRLQASEDARLLGQGVRLEVETFRRRKDGTRIRTALTRVPVSLAGGKIVIYGMYRDITPEKMAEDALRKSEANLRELLDERQRLSEDLHDHIVQAIYGLGMRLERLVKKGPPEVDADLRQVIDGLNQVIRDARQYISGSQPRRLTPTQFRAELMNMLEAPSAGTLFEIEIDAAALESLASNEMQHVLHVAREALSNTLRHARARHATLALERAGEDVRLEIRDDGVGFDPSQPHQEGRGLQNMESRARQMGARLDVASRAGHGSRIVLTLPAGGARAASAPLPEQLPGL